MNTRTAFAIGFLMAVLIFAISTGGKADKPGKPGKVDRRAAVSEQAKIAQQLFRNRENLIYDILSKDASDERLMNLLGDKQVPTPKKAREIAFKAFMRKAIVRSEQTVKVNELFELDVEVPDFSKSGDLIWRARLLTTDRGGGGYGGYGISVSGELWVNSEDGSVLDALARKP